LELITHDRRVMVIRSDVIQFTWLLPAAIVLVLWRKPNRALIGAALLFVAALIPTLGFTPFQFQYYFNDRRPLSLSTDVRYRPLQWPRSSEDAIALLRLQRP